ncbi:GNAT family N-acetyltransferase [Hydromonas duriensis]|uniref:RimJ/RimL family protein N-acetyltransferase n=1 Tax=Hydromonas duriensis TaxID=1527608 RepID=A0A4R6Y4G8_9BURK|nr:GNAT family protein [Hydromonas duriensis]TDR28979.1 RimJ/RimL family protein N-acetyltransferase [Hydromonas duriensis]
MNHTNSTALTGKYISLQPLTDSHFEAIWQIISSAPELYQYTTLGQTKEDLNKWFAQAKIDGAFVVMDNATQTLIGSTRLYNLNANVGHANLGYTWYAPECVGTNVNPEAKLLLLQHAFETLKLIRVGFEIDSDNMRSRKAVLKLGAQQEGILRKHRKRIHDGVVSDTCVFSIIQSEWDEVKINLQQRIQSS